MQVLTILRFFINLILILKCVIFVKTENTWYYEIIDASSDVPENDYYEIGLRAERIRRGENALTGYLDFKQDVEEDFDIIMFISYSSSGSSASFMRTPFHIPKMSITKYMSDYYHMYFDSNHPCLTNAPVYEGKFELPFPKCRIELNKCLPSTDALPNYIRPGYYRYEFVFNAKVNITAQLLVKGIIIDILETQSYINQNDYLDVDIYRVRISRGINGLSGYMNFTKDIVEEFLYEYNISYSASGNLDSFVTSIFRTPTTYISNAVNIIYRAYVDPQNECLTNAFAINGIFKLPFPKRCILLHNCKITTKNFPNYIKPGYYLAYYVFKNDVFEYTQRILCKVEG